MSVYEWTSYQTNPTVERWSVIPEFNTAITEFGSGVMARRRRWNQ